MNICVILKPLRASHQAKYYVYCTHDVYEQLISWEGMQCFGSVKDANESSLYVLFLTVLSKVLISNPLNPPNLKNPARQTTPLCRLERARTHKQVQHESHTCVIQDVPEPKRKVLCFHVGRRSDGVTFFYLPLIGDPGSVLIGCKG